MKKEEVYAKYEQEALECLENDEGTQPYLNEIKKAINGYYNTTRGIAKQVKAIVRGLYSEMVSQQMVFKNDASLGISHTNKATQVSLNGCMFQWECLNNLYSKFIYITYVDEITGESHRELDSIQTNIDAVIVEINNARNVEEKKLEDLADSLWERSNDVGFIGLIEDRGEVLRTANKKNIIKKIFVTNGVYDFIKESNLNVPTPSYMEELW